MRSICIALFCTAAIIAVGFANDEADAVVAENAVFDAPQAPADEANLLETSTSDEVSPQSPPTDRPSGPPLLAVQCLVSFFLSFNRIAISLLLAPRVAPLPDSPPRVCPARRLRSERASSSLSRLTPPRCSAAGLSYEGNVARGVTICARLLHV